MNSVRPSPADQPPVSRSSRSHCDTLVSWNSSTSKCRMRASSAIKRSVGASGVPSACRAAAATATKSQRPRCANTSSSWAAARRSTSTTAASTSHCRSLKPAGGSRRSARSASSSPSIAAHCSTAATKRCCACLYASLSAALAAALCGGKPCSGGALRRQPWSLVSSRSANATQQATSLASGQRPPSGRQVTMADALPSSSRPQASLTSAEISVRSGASRLRTTSAASLRRPARAASSRGRAWPRSCPTTWRIHWSRRPSMATSRSSTLLPRLSRCSSTAATACDCASSPSSSSASVACAASRYSAAASSSTAGNAPS